MEMSKDQADDTLTKELHTEAVVVINHLENQ